MKRTLCGLALMVSLSAPAFAQKITIDYAKDFDFGKVKTFAYEDPKTAGAKDPLMGERIEKGIIDRLKKKGLQLVTSDPDLIVTYFATTLDSTAYTVTAYPYAGYGMGWHRWGSDWDSGMVMATATATTYTKGTLIIDAFEPKERKLVWRGTGSVTVKDDPLKREKQLEKILAKMGERWAKILAKEGK